MATVTKSGRGGKLARKKRAVKRRPRKKLKDVVAARLKERFAAVAKSSGTDRLGRPEACGSPVRVPARVTKMLLVEMDNLEKVEALLRCLRLAMEHTDLTERGGPWFMDVVEVAANLAWRSNMDLQDLWDGRLVEPLLAQGRPAG
jgi:hypothetical protein